MQDEQATQGHPAAMAEAATAEVPPAQAGQVHSVPAAPTYPAPVPAPPPAPVPAAPANPATGEPRVDAALAGLSQLPGLPVAEHPAVFEQVHRQLREVLGELDSGSAGPGAAGHHGRPGR